ncbi:sigma-70 family RNA polymerase sigma factor [Psychrobium sp. MM17-31]|uniref:sigma-70 family RNA polymerase sigma factor n=1 Tax=Psychrobium sp. MM17-31 TaxID=2917758 RepID=UPI001EF527DB|nr:sigma-70 family RNA polymerase sigma factor [Psychrobium sp. MM17-31]MCG7531392.1 sigma-70 family RNA polymerase sigma factor [Psychrobium sp. MM17-31]
MIDSSQAVQGIKNHGNTNTMKQEQNTEQLLGWLIAVANERDKKAFSQLFSWFAPKILRYGVSHLNTQSNAQELLQETMSNVWKKAHYFNADKGAVTTWVYTIMRNASFDMLRKVQSNREEMLSDDIWPLVEAQAVEEGEYDDHLMQKEIRRYLSLLPDAQQQVIRGVYFQHLSQEELAKQLGVPVGTVKSRLRLALGKLKQKMGGKL